MNKHTTDVLVEKNALVDEGDGLIRFPNKLVITDDTEQRNNTRYDIPSMDMSEYKGQVTADHTDMLGSIIAKVQGLAKIGNKVTIDAIQYAVKENALARLAYDLLKGGYSTDFSIETYGEPYDDSGVYKNAKLIGLSQVVVGNNRSATLNQVVYNSIQQSKEDGLDIEDVEKLTNKETNVSKEETPQADAPRVDEPVPTPVVPVVPVADPTPTEDNTLAIKQMFESLQAKVDKMEQSAFDKGAQEPKFTIATNGNSGQIVKTGFEGMDWEDRAVNQIESFRRMEKQSDPEAAKTLRAINEVNLSLLKKEGMVKNAITIGDLGNYVIAPEQLSEIVGFRSNYGSLVNMFTFRETLSTVTQWLKRSGDINMTQVDYDDAAITSSGYLKPVSSYTATLETLQLEELAAVTPVANAATRFLAADILSDVNKGYRTDYERKLAQLIVVRLEQAVDGNGNSTIYSTTSDVNAMKNFTSVIASIAEQVPNGRLIMNHKSYWQMVSRATGAGISGPMSNLINTGEQANLFGMPVTLVPNDLLPTLNTAETRTFVVEGVNQVVNHAVFFVDPSNFVGRTSGGLMYDLSTDAAYETGGVVYSAFQRNQIVLRGAFFRGGKVSNTTEVSGLLSSGVS